jgi:hypothetical protein
VKKLALVFSAFILSLLLSSAAFAYTITDNNTTGYWGGTVAGAGSTAYGDVIGSPYFNIDQMNVTKSGNNWSVELVGAYFGYHSNPSVDGGLPARLGPGDLYINSSGWTATQGPAGHFETDTFTQSEGWNYVVSYNGTTMKWGLYSLDYSTIQYTNVGSGYIYRTDQAWKGGAGAFIGEANQVDDAANNRLLFTFNTGNMDWSTIGLHWTMQCGNDVIEGAAPVPEPSTMLLLGSGLVGLWGIRKKGRGHKNP